MRLSTLTAALGLMLAPGAHGQTLEGSTGCVVIEDLAPGLSCRDFVAVGSEDRMIQLSASIDGANIDNEGRVYAWVREGVGDRCTDFRSVYRYSLIRHDGETEEVVARAQDRCLEGNDGRLAYVSVGQGSVSFDALAGRLLTKMRTRCFNEEDLCEAAGMPKDESHDWVGAFEGFTPLAEALQGTDDRDIRNQQLRAHLRWTPDYPKRLLTALVALREERGLHGLQADALLVPTFDGANLRHRTWRRIVERAEAYHADGAAVRMKDLRDTFGSWLVSAGVQIQYVSRQLGHAGTQLTEKHYAAWVGGDDYIQPPRLQEGEVPADLLASLPQTNHTGGEVARSTFHH